MTFNPLDPQFKVDPYPTYRELIEYEPLHRSPFGPVVLSRYEDCLAVLRSPKASTDWRKSPRWGPGIDLDAPALSFLFLDPPDHTRLRSLVSRAFTPRRVDALRPRMQQIVDEIFDRVTSTGEMEVIGDLAFPLPVLVICELLGVPSDDVEEFKQWSAITARVLDPSFLLPPEVFHAAIAAGEQERAYFERLIARRRKEPRDDLLSALLATEELGDQLSEAEVVRTLNLLMIAGHETTVNLIGNGVLAFARHPEQFQRLRDDPSLIRSAVEEVLRFDPPVQLNGRLALDEIEVSSGTVPGLEEAILLTAAANRDPAQFADPDSFDIARQENRHLGFGFGIHHCLGAPLARLEGQVALATLARRFSSIELLRDPPPYKDNFTLRGIASLAVRLAA